MASEIPLLPYLSQSNIIITILSFRVQTGSHKCSAWIQLLSPFWVQLLFFIVRQTLNDIRLFHLEPRIAMKYAKTNLRRILVAP